MQDLGGVLDQADLDVRPNLDAVLEQGGTGSAISFARSSGRVAEVARLGSIVGLGFTCRIPPLQQIVSREDPTTNRASPNRRGKGR